MHFQKEIDTKVITFEWFKEKAWNIEHINAQSKQVY